VAPLAPFGLVFLALPQAVAERAVDPTSGHAYVRTGAVLSLLEAEAVARAAGAHLVAIESAGEEQFLLENFGGAEAYWIGLEFPRERWASGAELAFTHWAPGEPDGGASEPFTLLSWGEPGLWVDASGAAETQRFRALLEFPADAAVPETLPAPELPRARGVLLCAIQGLSAKDLENPRLPHLQALRARSAWTLDAAGDASADPLAGLGALLWGVGADKSRLSLAEPASAARAAFPHLVERVEHARPDVATVALLDDRVLAGAVLDGRVDLRSAEASARRGGRPELAREALARAAPLCVVATWTDLAGSVKPASRAKELAAIDAELGALLEALGARPNASEEAWWIAVAGVDPAPPPKGREDDARARTAVPLVLSAPGLAAGEILGEVALVDLVPSALAFLGIEPRLAWQLDGRVLALDAPARYGVNLLVNGDGEAQYGWSAGAQPYLPGWRQLAPFRLARHDERSRTPARGQSYFQGAGGELARMEQSVDLRALLTDVQRDAVRFRLTGRLGARGRAATITCTLQFLGERGKPLERFELAPEAADEGVTNREHALEVTGRVPRHARAARVILEARGAVNRSFADELALVFER
jgi:hypothetical protein